MTDTPDFVPRRRRPLWRKVVRDVLGPVLLLAGLVAAAWAGRIPLVETMGPGLLARAGLGPAGLSVEALTTDRLVLTDVTLAGGRLRAARLSVSFTLAGVARGRVGRVEIARAEASAAWHPDTGLDAGPFTPWLSGGSDGAGTPALPFDALALTDARLTLDMPHGPVRALGDVALDTTADRPALTADVTVWGTGVFAAATATARPWPVPEVRGTLTAQVEDRDHTGWVRGLSGGGTLTLEWRDGWATVTAEALALRAQALDPALLHPWHPALAALTAGPLALRLEPGADGAPPRVAVPLGPDLTPGAPRLQGRLRLETARLTATADARLTAAAADARDPLAAPAGTLDLEVQAGDAILPGLGSGATIAAAGRATLDGTTLAWTGTAPLRVTLPALLPGPAGTAAPVLGGPPVGPLTLRLTGRTDAAPWTAQLRPGTAADGSPAWTVALDGAATLADAAGRTARLAGALGGRLTRDAGLGVATLADVTLSVAGLTPAGLDGLTADLTSDRLTLSDGTLSGPVSVEAKAAALDHPRLTAEESRLTAAGTLTLTTDGATAALDRAALDLEAPTAADGAWRGPDTLTLALAPDRPQTVAVDWATSDGPAATLALAFDPIALDGTVSGRLEGLTMTGRLPATEDSPFTAAVAVPRARTGAWTVEDGRADLRLTPAGPTLTAAARLPALPGETAPRPGSGHPLRPLRVEVRAAPEADDPDRLSVDLSAGAPLRPTVATASGWIARNGSTGRLRLSGPPLPLGRDGVQPWHLYGALVDLSASAGTLALSGTLAWADGGAVRPDLSIGLADVDAAFGTTRLNRVNGVVRLTGLAPPASPSQELAAAGIELGLPFTDLVVRYRLDPGRRAFVLEGASMRLADGTITAGEAVVPLAGFDRVPLTLEVEGLDLGRLAALTPVDDLSVSGRVDGRVPLVITPGAVRIDAGRLAAVGPGVVRYTGTALPEGMQGVDLARRALEDFQFDALSMDVDGGTEDDMTVRVRLEGANAAVLDGYPFQLNVALTGPLTRMVQESLRGYTIPDRIRDRLRALDLDPGEP